MNIQTYEHNDIGNLDAFFNLQTFKCPIQTIDGHRIRDQYALVNADGVPYPARPVSDGYKLVPHFNMYKAQAERLKHSDLPTDNVTVIDQIIDGGLRATREIRFNDLRLDMPLRDGTDDGMVARMDTINSIDQSWAFQAFAGAYRAYCRNTQVFGGQKVYHARRKHTRNLSPEAITQNSIIGLSTFHANRDLLNRYRTIDLSRDEWVVIMEQTLCRNTGRGADATSDERAKVNARLLGQMLGRYDEEATDLGHNLWAGYNALTAWSTHVQETREFEIEGRDGVGILTRNNVRTTDNRVPHVQLQRQQRVRAVLDSDAWQRKLQAA
jgi:hypothetical protein